MSSQQPRRLSKYRRRTAVVGLIQGLIRGTQNRLGVSSDMVPMIDYDARRVECNILFPSFEAELAKKLGVDIVVIKTEKGYHLIPLMVLYPKGRMIAELSALKAYVEKVIREIEIGRLPRAEYPRILPGEIDAYISVLSEVENPQMFFDDFYRWLQREFDIYLSMGCIDPAHVDATLRRRYTTLRISGKECKPYDIRYLHIVSPDGTRWAIPLLEYLNLWEPKRRCVDIRRVLELIYRVVRARYPWVRTEAHRRILRYLVPTLG